MIITKSADHSDKMQHVKLAPGAWLHYTDSIKMCSLHWSSSPTMVGRAQKYHALHMYFTFLDICAIHISVHTDSILQHQLHGRTFCRPELKDKNVVRLQFKSVFPIRQSSLSEHICTRHLWEPADKVSLT